MTLVFFQDLGVGSFVCLFPLSSILLGVVLALLESAPGIYLIQTDGIRREGRYVCNTKICWGDTR